MSELCMSKYLCSDTGVTPLDALSSTAEDVSSQSSSVSSAMTWRSPGRGWTARAAGPVRPRSRRAPSRRSRRGRRAAHGSGAGTAWWWSWRRCRRGRLARRGDLVAPAVRAVRRCTRRPGPTRGSAVGRARAVSSSTSAIRRAGDEGAPAATTLRAPAGAAICSSVPQAWHDGQRPTHCADCCPHSAHR